MINNTTVDTTRSIINQIKEVPTDEAGVLYLNGMERKLVLTAMQNMLHIMREERQRERMMDLSSQYDEVRSRYIPDVQMFG